MKKWFVWGLPLLLVLGFLAGQVSALTVSGTYIDWHIFNSDSAGSIYTISDEPASFNDVTLFCPLDSMDTANNVTPCYLNGALTNATIVFNSTIGYPKLVQGKIGNAFEFDGNPHELVQVANFNYSTADFAFAFWVRINQQSTQVWYQVMGTANVRRVLLQNSRSGMKVLLQVWDASNTLYNVYSNTVLTPGKRWYYVVAGVKGGEAYIYINGELDASATVSTPRIPSALSPLNIGAYDTLGTYQLDGALDEVRYYSTMPSANEIKLLYLAGRKKLSGLANLTVASTTFDGSNFHITVNASLPAGAQYIYIPASATTSAPVVQNWSTGDKLVDVSGKNYLTFTITAPLGGALKGVKSLGIKTNEGFYAYGTGTWTPSIATTTLYRATNTIIDGKVTSVSWNMSVLAKLDTPITVSAGTGKLQIFNASIDYIKLNALSVTSPIKLTDNALLPYKTYTLLQNDNKVEEVVPDDQGVATFTISSTGTWVVATMAKAWNDVSSNVIHIVMTALLVGVFAAIVVERTPSKFDDRVVGTLEILVIVAILTGLIKLILLLR